MDLLFYFGNCSGSHSAWSRIINSVAKMCENSDLDKDRCLRIYFKRGLFQILANEEEKDSFLPTLFCSVFNLTEIGCKTDIVSRSSVALLPRSALQANFLFFTWLFCASAISLVY